MIERLREAESSTGSNDSVGATGSTLTIPQDSSKWLLHLFKQRWTVSDPVKTGCYDWPRESPTANPIDALIAIRGIGTTFI